MNYKKSILGSSIAFIIATSCCWLPALFIAIGGGATLVCISQGLEQFSGLFIGMGICLFAYGGYQYYTSNLKPKDVILQSIFTCPKCSFQKEETMPTNACQYFYECTNCKQVLKPTGNDCCVFCSFGTVACPPVQLDQVCC